MTTRSELVEVDVIVVHQTDKAILVRLDEDAANIWLPLSAVEVVRKPASNVALVTLSRVMARDKGLV